MSKEAYRFSGNDAANYDQYLGPLIFEPSAIEFLTLLSTLPAQSILETSCGTGRLTRHLRREFPSSTRITATDISPDMMSLARERLKNQSVEFILADGQQPPFPDQSFDLVVNQYGLMFFPDKQKGFNEAYRVLNPGGYFAFATWDRTDSMPLFKIPIDDNIIPFFKGQDTRRFYMPFSLHDPESLLGLLKNAGFQHNKVIRMEFTGSTSSPMAIVDGLFLKHPLGREVSEKDPEAVGKMAEAIKKSLVSHFGPGPFDFELKALIGIGQK